MTSSTPLKWHQFRLRSLLVAVLSVQLACILLSPHLLQVYEQYESRRRLRATVAILKADLDNALAIVVRPSTPRYSGSTFEYVEGPIGPVQTPDGTEGSDRDLSDASSTAAP